MGWTRQPLLDKLLSHEGTPGLAKAFLDREGPFEGDLLHTLPGNDPNTMTLEDLFAVTLLDVRVGPRGVRRILFHEETRAQLSALLQLIPTNVDLWDGSEHLHPDGPASTLWRALQREGDAIGPVTAGKLLARKRPRLIPIVDSVVEAIVSAPPGSYWTTLSSYLQNERRRARLEELRPRGEEAVTVLRMLDVSLWMWGSQSRAAKAVREALGIPRLGWSALALEG